MVLPYEIVLFALALAGPAALLVMAILLWRRFRARRKKKPVQKKPSLDFSVVGIVYCSLLLFMGLAAINSQANLLFGVFGLMIGILLISGVISRRVMHGIKVRRTLPDHGTVGRAAMLSYEVTNTKRFWASMSLTLSELDGATGFIEQPAAYLLHAPPRTAAIASAEVVPTRRGLHRFDRFQISSSFPFGFINRSVTQHRAEVLLVYPPLALVDQAVLRRCKAVDKTGAAIHPTKGGSDEFYGVKEHRPGDNPRYIHWRRSARTASMGVLVAREMTQVAPPRIVILLDTFMPDNAAMPDSEGRRNGGIANGGVAKNRASKNDTPVIPASPQADLEYAIAIAASMAAAALEAELSVGLICWTDGWRVIEPGYGKRHRNDLLSVLARLPANNTMNADDLLLQGRRLLRSGTTGVFCTAANSPSGATAPQRGAMIVLTPHSAETRGYFRFDPHIDFTRCVPQADADASARKIKS